MSVGIGPDDGLGVGSFVGDGVITQPQIR
jgi:hypothetical protein